MDKQRKQIIITAGLVVVLIIAWANTFKAAKKRSKPKQPTPAAAAAATAFSTKDTVSIPQNQQAFSRKESTKDDQISWGRCPFSGKIFYGEAKALDLKLSGILWDVQNPQAIINDEIWGEGEKIGKFEVIEIHPEEVIVSDGTEKFELEIY